MRTDLAETPLPWGNLFSTSFFLLVSAPGCGALNPFNDYSIWRSAHGVVESALLDGKAAVLAAPDSYSVWQKVDEPKNSFHTGSREKKTFGGYRVIPIKPGEYALAGGYNQFDDSTFNLQATTKEYLSSRLGRVDLSNEDVTETYEYQEYEFPEHKWETDSNGNSRWVETRPGGHVARTGTRVIGHYVAGYIVAPDAGAAGKPLWASFRVAPGEVIVLQSVGFYGLKPDYARCRSTSFWSGSWSCPISSLQFALGAEPDLEKCRAAAVEAAFPPALVGRIIGRNVTLETLLGEPHREINPPSGWTEGRSLRL